MDSNTAALDARISRSHTSLNFDWPGLKRQHDKDDVVEAHAMVWYELES